MDSNVKICQSCGMPIDKDPNKGGTNSDGSKSEKYCSYCFQNGKFTDEGITFQEKIEENVRIILSRMGITEEQARNNAESLLSNLDRWKYVEKFKELVNERCRQYHSVQYYANELCITPNYLNEQVKKNTGFTAKQFINNKLFFEAKKLLLNSQTPIAEIANMLNFENPPYFVRFFRKQSGSTPFQYRIKNMKP